VVLAADEDGDAARTSRATRFGRVLGGPLVGAALTAILFAVDVAGLGQEARFLAGITVWMAIWWLTEPLPLGVTALIPLVAFPPLQILSSKDVAAKYSMNLMWLFFGGFQLAFAVQRADLHRRVALKLMSLLGTKQALLMLGIMMSVGILSMFLSNTSTTLMIVPVAQAIASSLDDGSTAAGSLGKPLMLGVGYAASCGGMGTLIGTPPNGVLAAQAEIFGLDIDFASWMGFGMPLSVLLIVLLWVYFVVVFKVPFKDSASSREGMRQFLAELGPMTQAEVRVGLVFLTTVALWVSRKWIIEGLGLPTFGDDVIAVGAALAMFLIPAKYKDGRVKQLMDWDTLLQTPWQILFLFGGGFALAAGFQETLLSKWLGEQLAVLDFLPPFLLVLAVVLLVTFLTEVTSNTATSNVLLPIIGELARALDLPPALLMVPATLAASCAFMLPVATPPNAIVFATGLVPMKDMARTGFFVNLGSGVVITAWMFTWGSLFFNDDATAPAP